MQIRGATGEIRWSYLTAATFGPWRLDVDGLTGTLTGAVVRVDAFRMGQAPLAAVLTVGRQTLSYPIESVTQSGSVLTATVGPRVDRG